LGLFPLATQERPLRINYNRGTYWDILIRNSGVPIAAIVLAPQLVLKLFIAGTMSEWAGKLREEILLSLFCYQLEMLYLADIDWHAFSIAQNSTTIFLPPFSCQLGHGTQ
jgi:hypothetical protein